VKSILVEPAKSTAVELATAEPAAMEPATTVETPAATVKTPATATAMGVGEMWLAERGGAEQRRCDC
jgi:hypothetical protein